MRHPELKISTPAHTRPLGWYLEFAFRVTQGSWAGGRLRDGRGNSAGEVAGCSGGHLAPESCEPGDGAGGGQAGQCSKDVSVDEVVTRARSATIPCILKTEGAECLPAVSVLVCYVINEQVCFVKT